ncbi:helix-turn-helix domain-containing protein [Phaeovulum sp. W22_SRMD_FR3]|uniref:helix-turn-helix domain-containing protein n=1 Tax=Phaeovulum sp. W22_SRMD_FR3 TaxID=3240274 RepID=UPI003F9A32CF
MVTTLNTSQPQPVRSEPSPHVLRETFGSNLRILCKGAANISETCRALGINRTQFNRYLNGSAFPRPDVLYRICQHFKVDARILLEPLSSQQAPAFYGQIAQIMSREGRADNLYALDEALMPSGYYRIWRRSFTDPSRAVVGMVRVWRDGPVTRLKTYEPAYAPPTDASVQQRPKMQMLRGILFRGEDGITAMVSIRPSRLFRISHFRQGFAGFGSIYAGFSVLTRDTTPGMVRSSGTILEHLDVKGPPLRTLARATGFREADNLPALFRDFILSPNPV